MNACPLARPRNLLLCAALALGPVSASLAQSTQVTGSQLQAWLSQNFSYAGLHHASGCYFLNSADPAGRVLFMSCPNGWSAKILGSIRVQGDMACTNFQIPNTPAGEECLEWHRVGDGKYEQRDAKGVSSSLYVLGTLKR